jgi:preprotein translocase subunit SecD
MSVSFNRIFFSWFTFWVVLAALGIFMLYPIRQKLRFGIDLVGGTYITLDVQVDKAVESELLARLQAITILLKDVKDQPVSKKVEDNKIELTFTSPVAASQAGQLIYDSQNKIDARNRLKQEVDGSTIRLWFSNDKVKAIKDDAVSRNVEVLHNRLNKVSVEEISVAPQGDKSIVVELPDVADPQQAKAMIGKAAVLEFKIVEKTGRTEEDILYELDGDLPGDMEILPGKDGRDGTPNEFYLVPKFSEITGKLLKNAAPSLDQTRMQTIVNFEFTTEGGDKFYDLTSKNLYKRLAVVLDGVVITAPTINAKIRNEGMIEGNFTPDSAKELAMLLKSGSFVAPVSFEEERQIGPSLGAESIRQGFMSCLVGLGLLFIFSLFFYKVAGFLAFLALVFNLLLTLLFMSWLNATLTLPGIAGMVLTIGMAVDASILIYEEIKEALAAGMSTQKAVAAGFKDAAVVILDANITTFIVGVVLYYFGTGPIKGFAVTMMLGIISTLITGLFFLRSLFNVLLDGLNVQKLRI